MKIGILTFHCAHNYGAMLQAYALPTKLRILGYDAEIIDFRLEYIYNNIENNSIFQLFHHYYKNEKKLIIAFLKTIKNLYSHKHKSESWYRFEDFLNCIIPKSKRVYRNQLCLANYDVIICGSDQIWNEVLTGGAFEPVYFGIGFSEKIKVISYAASNGHSRILDKNKATFFQYIKRLQHVSVREKGFHLYLNNIGLKNTLVLDPIFLLERNDWDKIAIMPKEDDYILSYSFNESPNYFQKALYVSKKLNKKLVCFTFRKKKHIPSEFTEYYIGGPREFLGYFSKASYVITNSFHGTAFSILYKKDFICVPPLKRRERIDSLLSIFRIKETIVEDSEDMPLLLPKIDTASIQAILNEKRSQSVNYLISSIKK